MLRVLVKVSVWSLEERMSRLELELELWLGCWVWRGWRPGFKQLDWPFAAAFLKLESRPTKSPSRFMLDVGLCIVFFLKSVCRGLSSPASGSCRIKFWVLVKPDGVLL